MNLFGNRKRKKSQYDITSVPHMKPTYYAGTEERTKYNNYVSPNAVPVENNEVPTKYNHVYSNLYENKTPTKYNNYVTENPGLDLRPAYSQDGTNEAEPKGNILSKIGGLFKRNGGSGDTTSIAKTGTSKGAGINYKSPYDLNVFGNSLMSGLRHAPTWDSIGQYYNKKKNTPDLSDFENAKNEAAKPTNVMRQSANHVSGNYKANIYDYTEGQNRINAQSSATKNILARQSRGNFGQLASYLGGIDGRTIGEAGQNAINSWKANEENRMNAYKLNQASDQFNAQADNQADANYINARNSAAMQDHNNRIAAMNNYASNKYNINHTYQKELDEKRDAMVKNIANEGMNAYNNNKTNTNKKYNYWYDNNGVMRFIDGERPIEAPERQQINISDDMIDKFEQGANVEQKNMLTSLIKQYGGNKAIARQVWANYLINSAKQG